MFQVFLVENDRQLNHMFSLYLQKEGWDITSFLSGDKAFRYVDRCPHIWVLDSWLPGMDGYQLLNEIKEKYPATPVLFISERNSGSDRVIGLEMGCDDYLGKPFLPKELVIRTRKILERTYGNGLNILKNKIYHVEDYRIDEMDRCVKNGTKILKLTTKELDMLLLFAKNPLRVFTREQILRYLWSDDHSGSDRSVDDLVRRLRLKMPQLRVETIYGYGYRMLSTSLPEVVSYSL